MRPPWEHCDQSPTWKGGSLQNLVFWQKIGYFYPQISLKSQKFTASTPAAFAYYGASVGISGRNIIVGANNTDSGTGTAYVYTHLLNTNTWKEYEILASDRASSDNFGLTVGISGDNAVIGAWGDDTGGSSAGQAYIFSYNVGTDNWDETKLNASDSAANLNFGNAVAIDGIMAVIGCYHDDDNGAMSGSAYIYTRTH